MMHICVYLIDSYDTFDHLNLEFHDFLYMMSLIKKMKKQI